MATKKTATLEEPTTAALTVKTATNAAMAVAEGADRTDARGKANIDRDDIILPRIAIAQSNSPQLKRHEGKYIEGLEEGQMFNTLTGENYGNGPLEFVVLDFRKRAMQFGENNTILDFNVPWNDERCEFTNDDAGKRVKPIATRFYEFIVLLVPTHEMVVLSLKSKQVSAAKRLNSFLSVRPGAAWMGKYKLSTFMDRQNSYTFGNFRIDLGGPTAKDTIEFADAAYTMISKVQVKYDHADDSDDEGSVQGGVNDAKVPF